MNESPLDKVMMCEGIDPACGLPIDFQNSRKKVLILDPFQGNGKPETPSRDQF